jgi:hypothetical protein
MFMFINCLNIHIIKFKKVIYKHMKLQNKMTVFTYKMGIQTIHYLLKQSVLSIWLVQFEHIYVHSGWKFTVLSICLSWMTIKLYRTLQNETSKWISLFSILCLSQNCTLHLTFRTEFQFVLLWLQWIWNCYDC